MAKMMVSTLVVKDDAVLMVRENRIQYAGLWNLPAGHVEELLDEDIADAAVRETRSESGYDVRLTDFMTVVDTIVEGRRALVFVYIAELISEEQGEYDTEEINAVAFVPIGDFEGETAIGLRLPAAYLRFPKEIQEVLRLWKAGERPPIVRIR